MIEGSLEVKLPTIWTDEKQRWEESEKRRDEERRSKKRKSQKKERSKKRKSQKKEDADARKGRKVAKHCVSPNDSWAPEGRKVGSLKRRVRSQLARWEIEKLHAVVARSTCPSQNVQSTPGSEHFFTRRSRKSARCCGAKHISKSNC